MNTSSAPCSDQQNIQLQQPGKSARTLAHSKITDLGSTRFPKSFRNVASPFRLKKGKRLVFTMKHCTFLLALAAILISGSLRAQVDDGLWTPSGANIYRGTGNIGIGTSAPTHRLAI